MLQEVGEEFGRREPAGTQDGTEGHRARSVVVSDGVYADLHRIQRGARQRVAIPLPVLQERRRWVMQAGKQITHLIGT